ncbi:MAG: ABC transporter ATP-binding protein [Planctomycetia bacterium]|nr:ABC transporter ATP-binding protein [Planctomycetia bacterium]
MNFLRILKISLKYKYSLIFSLLTALGVGILWGTNLSAVYPFMQLTFRGESLQTQLESQITSSEALIKTLQEQYKDPSLPEPERKALGYKLMKEEYALKGFRWIQPAVLMLPSSPVKTIFLLLVTLLAFTLLKSLFLIANVIFVARVTQHTILDVRTKLLQKCLEMDMTTYSTEGNATLISRMMNDVNGISAGIDSLLGKLVREPIKMLVCLGIALWIHWQLFVITLLVVPLIGWIILKLAKNIKRYSHFIMQEVAKLYKTLEETFFGIKIVKCFMLESHETQQFLERGETVCRGSIRVAFFDALAKGVIEFSGIFIVSLALFFGAWMVISGGTHIMGIPLSSRPLTFEWLVMFYVALLGAADPARRMSDIFTSIQNALAASDRVCEMLDAPIKVQQPQNPVKIMPHEKDIIFDNVSYHYSEDRPVLKNVSLRIPFGETVAIVGPNGCGKSTLINLIPRLADPSSGQVRLDGIPLPEISLEDLRSQIGIVSQDAILFDNTVMNNIRMGRQNATDEEVIDAAKKAFAHEFIESVLPQGYHTPLGPLGGQLSGGQRQRIALARVILRQPRILLLDEATSQIDLESERSIQKALSEFHHGRTVIIVTHRLALLNITDRIIVMGNGNIISSGTHDELLNHCEFYQQLYQ